MTTEQTEAPQWGAPAPPPPSRSRWTGKRIVVALAIALGIAGAGGAAIYAASGSVTSDQSPGGRGGAGGPMIIGGPMGGSEGVQHGEFQSGEVTAISDTSVTAKSEDGYTKTYTIDSDTQKTDDIAKGDDVVIVANTDGTAESIVEPSAMSNRRNGGGAPPNGAPPSGNPSDGN